MNKIENYLKKFAPVKIDDKFKENLKRNLKKELLCQKANQEILFDRKLAFVNACLIILIAGILSLQFFTKEVNYTQTTEKPEIILIEELKDIGSAEYIFFRININNGAGSFSFAEKNKLLKEIFKEG